MATALDVLLALREAVAAADREREALADFDAATPPSAEIDAERDIDARDADTDRDAAPPRLAERDAELDCDADLDGDVVPPLDAERDGDSVALEIVRHTARTRLLPKSAT